MDITRKNAVKLNKQELINHILSFSNISVTGDIDMMKVISQLEIFWNMFKSLKVGKDILQPKKIERNKIYYSEQHGFIKVFELHEINKSTIKVIYSIPGVGWDDEVSNYVSSGYHYPPARLFTVNYE